VVEQLRRRGRNLCRGHQRSAPWGRAGFQRARRAPTVRDEAKSRSLRVMMHMSTRDQVHLEA